MFLDVKCLKIKIKRRSFKSSEHINEIGDGPYHNPLSLNFFE